ncbi:MAG: hypothetical protein ACKVOT_18025 [Polaromonas sp.]
MTHSTTSLPNCLVKLQKKTELLGMQHDTFSRNTRNQLRQVFEALRELTALPEAAPQQLIGLVRPKDSQGPTGKL